MDNPIITYYNNGNVASEHWRESDQFHRPNGPAEIWYYETDDIKSEHWYKNGILHRTDGPAEIYYDRFGQVTDVFWFLNKKVMFPHFEKWPLTYEQQIELKLKYG